MIFQDYIHQFAQILTGPTGMSYEDIVGLIEFPPQKDFGDLAFPCFALSKKFKQSPQQIAEQIVGSLQLSDFFSSSQAVGPYINVFVNLGSLASTTITTINTQKDKYGSQTLDRPERIIIESPSPNTNKPLHLGHVRNMLLGNTLVNVLRFLGHEVIRADIVNDRGIHICKSMLAYKKLGNNQQPNKKSDHFVGDFYVLFDKMSKEDPTRNDEALQMLRDRERGDPELHTLRKTMNQRALDGFGVTYKKYGTIIDDVTYESDIYRDGKAIILDAEQQGIFERDEKNNVVYRISDDNKKVVLRGDGTAVYATQDIALAKLRRDKFAMDRMIYVVGNEQEDYFRQLFSIFKALKYQFWDKAYHLSYGMIELPEGKMKSREGNVIDADTIVDELQSLIKEIVTERYTDWSDEELDQLAEDIALGALKFFILKFDASQNFVFDKKVALSFEGETGPYVQYAYARFHNIIQKSGYTPDDLHTFVKNNPLHIGEEEKHLIVLIAQWGSIVKRAGDEYKPQYITRYAMELAHAINTYYHHTPILGQDKIVMMNRLVVVDAVLQVMHNCLTLLGIKPLTQM